MLKGYAGVILRVNLSTGEIKREGLNEEQARLFIGGRGYGTKIIYDEIDPKVDPLSPENKVVIATGPTSGSTAPSSGRTVVVTKGALNGAIACSNAGGFFGPELKQAGYDMVVLEGKAKSPVYLWINNDNVELRDAQHMWGKTVFEVDKIMKQETDPKARVMTIGPAGVKLSLMSCLIVDTDRAAGRTGVGANVGSKNLLGIAVRGTKKIELFDPKEAKKAASKAIELIKTHAVTGIGKALPTYGTSVLVNIINELGIYPTRNFQDAYFPTADNTGGEAIAEKILIKRGACARCPIGCKRVTEIREGKYKGEHGMGPEYETTWSLGAMCSVDDLNAITKAHYLCNEYGLEALSVGVTVACAMELYEKGYIPEKDTPFPIRFGDGDALVKLVEMMGKREGIGDLLAEGSYRLAEHYGHPELSMSVKKQELSAYDPRGMKGMGLGIATSTSGGHHMRAFCYDWEIRLTPSADDRLKYENKVEMIKNLQDLTAVIDSSGMCLFTVRALGVSEYTAILRVITGIPYSEDEVMKAGERIWNLERLFDLRAGFTKKDDAFPPRLSEPIPTGASKGEIFEIDRILPEYYKLRGWDEDGIPTKEKLAELGL